MNRCLPVLRIMAPIALIFGLTMSFPLALSYMLADGAATAYAAGMAITAGLGLVLLMLTRRHAGELRVPDGFLLVTLAWTVLPAFATLPLVLYLPGLGFTDAYFETAAVLKVYRADPEVAAYLAVVLGSAIGLAGYLWHADTYPELGAALRFATFNVVTGWARRRTTRTSARLRSGFASRR